MANIKIRRTITETHVISVIILVYPYLIAKSPIPPPPITPAIVDVFTRLIALVIVTLMIPALASFSMI